MPNEYSRALRELVKAKVENRAPEVAIEAEGKPMPPVINIMDALKKSMQKQGANQGARYRAKTHGQSGCSQSASELFTGAEGGIEAERTTLNSISRLGLQTVFHSARMKLCRS